MKKKLIKLKKKNSLLKAFYMNNEPDPIIQNRVKALSFKAQIRSQLISNK